MLMNYPCCFFRYVSDFTQKSARVLLGIDASPAPIVLKGIRKHDETLSSRVFSKGIQTFRRPCDEPPWWDFSSRMTIFKDIVRN